MDDARTKTREVRRSISRRPPATTSPAPESAADEGDINWDQDPATYPVETWESVR